MMFGMKKLMCPLFNCILYHVTPLYLLAILKVNFNDITAFKSRVSHSSVWPWICYITEDDLEILILLPPAPKFVTIGIYH